MAGTRRAQRNPVMRRVMTKKHKELIADIDRRRNFVFVGRGMNLERNDKLKFQNADGDDVAKAFEKQDAHTCAWNLKQR